MFFLWSSHLLARRLLPGWNACRQQRLDQPRSPGRRHVGKHCTGFDTPTQAPVSLSLPPAPQPLLPGAERQVQALLSRYGPEKLYQVTSNISGAGTLDLKLLRGQIVALLQNKDTKGNSSRWLVDTGGTWDFVGSSPASGKTTQQEPVGRSGH